MQRALPILMIASGIALAVVIGQNLTTDVQAVIIGLVVGIVAAVPTSLLLVALLRRERSAVSRPATPAPVPAYEPAPAPAYAPARALRQGPPPVAPDKVRILLGHDSNDMPCILDFGGTDAAANLLVVKAPDIIFTLLAAVAQAGWEYEPVTFPRDLAHWAHVCRDRQSSAHTQPRTLLVLEDLADLLTDDRQQRAEVNRLLAYLTTHGPAVGLHVLAGAQHPDVLQELDLPIWPVRIAGPTTDPAALAAALAVSHGDAAAYAELDCHWLSAVGYTIDFCPAPKRLLAGAIPASSAPPNELVLDPSTRRMA